MAKTIVTQFGEFLNYANIVKIGIETNWEDAEIDEESGTITSPDYEMIGTDTSGTRNAVAKCNQTLVKFGCDPLTAIGTDAYGR